MKKLILIDGNAILHRAYHALPPFKTTKGELVNAVYGFASMLLNILNTQKPEFIAVSFDTKVKTFRHEEYKEYKATRVKAPDDLYAQIPRIYEIVNAFAIPVFTFDGYEADDVLGSLAVQASAHPDIMTYIVTGDMDMSQLINSKINLLLPVNGFKESSIFDEAKVFEKYGIAPTQVADMKGLQGDNSDNIKGVPGVGPKTTRLLLQKYKTIEGIYEHLNEIDGKLRENLAAHKDDAFFSKRMATIITNLELKLDLEKCQSHEFDSVQVHEVFADLEFSSLLKKLENFEKHAAKIPPKSQGTLF